MLGFILNIPYTVIGLIMGLISFPNKIYFKKKPYAFILNIKKFWWAFGYMKNARAMAIGQVVLLSPSLEANDLEHELIHVRQYERAPIIHPILYLFELKKNGYKNNKYEIEAYAKAGNFYRDVQ